MFLVLFFLMVVGEFFLVFVIMLVDFVMFGMFGENKEFYG